MSLRVDQAHGQSSLIKHSYGSTEDDVVQAASHESETLVGEAIITTDNEEEARKHRIDMSSNILQTLRQNHPVGHVTRIVLVMGVVICMCILAFVLSPIPSFPSSAPSSLLSTRLPFPVIDRVAYSQPADAIVNPNLFHPSLLFNATAPAGGKNSIHPLLNVPFPTGAFWTNLVLQTTSDRSLSFPAVTYPYAFKWSPSLLQASYPALHRRTDSLSIRDTFIPDMTFSTTERIAKRYVTQFDPLSVTTRFLTDGGGYWEAYLVQGSPYTTLKYAKSTPTLTALSTFKDVVCPFDADGNYNDGTEQGARNKSSSELRDVKGSVCRVSKREGDLESIKTLSGVQFLLQTQEGLSWILFASEPIAVNFNTDERTKVVVNKEFSGVLRLALVPPTPGDESGSAPFSTSTGLRRLVYHSRVYPVSGSVSWSFQTLSRSSSIQNGMANVAGKMEGTPSTSIPTERVGTIHFQFDIKQMNPDSAPDSSEEELLMLSLPHHAESLRSDVLLQFDQFDLVYMSIKGRMTPVIGGSWSYEEPLNPIGFDDMATNKRQPEDLRSVLMENVKNDIGVNLPRLDENIYGYGKQVARLAQLAYIANSISPVAGEADDGFKATTESAIKSLHALLVRFLRGDVTDGLLFDGNFGGLVTKAGLLNSDADFGNGWYNDHHFHYGYILYACAIMGNINGSFVEEYSSYVDALLFDVAHDVNMDSYEVGEPFFPLARHKSWFDGHSFASGLFPFANGKSQESSSEAVNCYMGAYLWSLVRFGIQDSAGQARTDFARLLLATEIRGARKYWHMLPPKDTIENAAVSKVPQVYDSTFSKNYMVGNLGMLDAVCSTWFGTSSLYVHMINFIPVTAATSQLFDKTYVREEFRNVLGALLPTTEMAWKGFVVCDQAIVDPAAAWKEAQELVSIELDASLSKSQVLYFISTRPGFKLVAPILSPSAPEGSKTNTSANGQGSSSCESNQGCLNLGLRGSCCPTPSGVMLGCCDSER